MDSNSGISKAMKRNILGAFILTLSIVIIGVSTSYSYFVNAVQEENAGNQGVKVTSGALEISFATTSYINASAATLTTESAVVAAGTNYTAFSIGLPSDKFVDKASYRIYLTNIRMTDNFKSQYLKWALYSGSTRVTGGDFSGVTVTSGKANDFNLLTNKEILKGGNDDYSLYMWLENDPNNNQISLLDGSISAQVAFEAQTKG